MVDEIRLTYKRAGELYSGDIKVSEAGVPRLWSTSKDTTFKHLMTGLATCIREYHGEPDVILSREELPGSSYRLERALIDLFVMDPAAAIRSFNHPDRTVQVRSVTPVVRAGTATLVDSFGEYVYIRCKPDGKSVLCECPFCGRWKFRAFPLGYCWHCGYGVVVTRHSDSWMAVAVDSLLLVATHPLSFIDAPDRFFLPRAWNGGPWISRKDLRLKLDSFRKERDQC